MILHKVRMERGLLKDIALIDTFTKAKRKK